MMKIIKADKIIDAVKNLCIEANFDLGEDVLNSFKSCRKSEESPTGKLVLDALMENASIASTERTPICQDTGFTTVFVEIGQDVNVEGPLTEAINEGVRQGYKEGYLRKSICDPFTRKNTGDNTPAVVYYEVVEGDSLKIIISPKGGGSSNMARLTMLKPADGIEGIKEFVVNRAREASSNPCPPVIIGVGIGGTPEKVAFLSTQALLRPLGTENPEPRLKELEQDLLKTINNLGMGPQGLGGRCYAMAVHVKMFPTHIACLPVAVNICCHASRHKEIVL